MAVPTTDDYDADDQHRVDQHRLDESHVAALLGRTPMGSFTVVVRRADGSPVVLRNAPLLDDGRPMPTRYWMADRELNKVIGRLESAGSIDRIEAQIGVDAIAEIHRRYETERDASLPPDHVGPRPTGGVGGTRIGVKCLHAHYANFLVTGDDAVGAWVDAQLALTGDAFNPDQPGIASDDRTSGGSE